MSELSGRFFLTGYSVFGGLEIRSGMCFEMCIFGVGGGVSIVLCCFVEE